MDARQLRAAHASAYFASVHAFLASPSAEPLHALNVALKTVDSEDIIADEVCEPVKHAKKFLNVNGSELEAAHLILNLFLLKPDGLWDPAVFAQAVHTVTLKLAANDAESRACVRLLTKLIALNRVPEHLVHLICGSCAQSLFTSSVLAAECTRFLAVCLATLNPPARESLVQETLAKWRLTEASGSVLADLVLETVLLTNQISKDVLIDAAQYNSTSAVSKAAARANSDSVALANTVARKLVLLVYPEPRKSPLRTNIAEFMAVCARKMLLPRFPSAEVVCSAFYATCFALAQVYKNEKYYSFLFSVVDAFYSSFKAVRGAEVKLNADECRDLVLCSVYDDAVFITTRLASKYDVSLICPALQQYTQTSTQTTQLEWIKYLQQWPVSEYLDKTGLFFTKLANNVQLSDKHQVEVFKLMSRFVGDEVCVFDSVWLDRTAHASASVCDALVLTLMSTLSSQPSLSENVSTVAARAMAPGAGTYKKRLLQLLEKAYSYIPSVCWRYALVCAGDSDKQVSSLAAKLCTRFLNTAEPDPCAALLEAVKNAPTSKLGLHAFSSECDVMKMQKLVEKLISGADFELAALLVESNGHFMPPKDAVKVISVSGPSFGFYLRMLDAMLLARPRVLLPPYTASSLFQYLARKLRVCTDSEATHLASVLGQLVFLGNLEAQTARKRVLASVSASAFANLNATIESEPVYCQLVRVCACTKFWEFDDQKPQLRRVVEKLTAFAADLPRGSPRKLATLRAVFDIVASDAELLDLDGVNALFDTVAQNKAELQLFTKLLLAKLATPQKTRESSVSQHARLFSVNKTPDSTIVFTEKYFAPVLECARSGTDLLALKAVIKIVNDKLAAAEKCFNVIIACCFASRTEIAQTAFNAFCLESKRRPAVLISKLGSGVLLADSTYNSLDSIVFARLVDVLYLTAQKPQLVQQLAGLLASAGLDCLKTCITGLMHVKMQQRDAKLLVSSIDATVRVFEPSNLVHTDEDCVKMALVHTYSLWLRAKHGLSVYLRAHSKDSSLPDLEPFNVDVLVANCAVDPRIKLADLLQLPDAYTYAAVQRFVAEPAQKRVDVFAQPVRKRVIED